MVRSIEWSTSGFGLRSSSLCEYTIIYDLPEAVNSNIKLFADDSKLLSITNGPENNINLQKELNAICERSGLWGMRLNVETCKTVYFGRKNLRRYYFMSDSRESKITLRKSKLVRDLVVMVSEDLKWEGHINTIVNKANRLLGLLKRILKRFAETLVFREICMCH